MPPRTRAVKASKENVNVLTKNNVKPTSKATKLTRKPLADKTNSASDENASPEPLQKVIKTNTKTTKKVVTKVIEEERPRRNRRLPTRYVENQVLNNLSNSKENAASNKPADKSPVKDASKVESPFKSPKNVLDSSLLARRSKRESRLPSKFDEQFVSPIKFTPIQPCHTSTPLVQKPSQPKNVQRTSGNEQIVIPEKVMRNKTVTPQKVTSQKVKLSNESVKKASPKKISPQKPIQKVVQKKLSEVVKRKADANSNGREDRTRRLRKPVAYKEVTLSPKIKSPGNEKPKIKEVKKITALDSSFRVLEERKDGDNQDVYEFTFDPSEEPLPQKKKRKKVTIKKPAKPKTRFFNNNYEKNIAKALADLKNVVSKQKPEGLEATSKVTKPDMPRATDKKAQQVSAPLSKPVTIPNSHPVLISTTVEVHADPGINNSIHSNVSTKNHASIRVEDIAADFEASIDHDDINYSPIHSPERVEVEPRMSPHRDVVRTNDPLNLRNDLSFFDDQPAASSSMNMSNRNPMSTPWRVEFESLPIKWQANTYVKPDMTPALESSYINNFDDSKKKHVYTNMVLQENEPLPEIVEAPKLKQTSIVSFIKEVVEKSAKKKQKGKPGTPKKASSLFDDPNTSIDANANKTGSSVANNSSGTSNKNSCSENDTSTEGKSTQKRKHVGDKNPTPAKVPRKENDNTFFGFEDTENQDQENVSPVNVVNTNRLRSLRSRSGAVLKELNKQTGPMRAELPAAMKSKLAPSSDVVERIYDQMKSASDAPVLLEKQIDGQATNIADMPDDSLNNEDSQSVHLFEDIELVHHLKPTRKSYGKAKKVTFGQNSSDSGEDAPAHNLSTDEDAEDLSFYLPEVKQKKATKKKKKNKKDILSKKEKAEVEEWAANFNSMCEDVEEFDLVVE